MTFKNIMFPVDFSDYSRALNPEVEYLAQRFNSDVMLLHVFEIPFTWYGSGDAPLMDADCLQQYIEGQKRCLNDYRINVPENRVQRILAQGDVAWQIKTFADENAVDLVIIGTHGYGAVRRLLLGSVAMKVLHDVSWPVWTHFPEKMNGAGSFAGVKKILCALDLNEEAVPLLRFISDLANSFEASVRLIHSVPGNELQLHQNFDNDLYRFLAKIADEEIAKLQQEAGTHFNVDLLSDGIGEATAILAGQEGADLVVIGRGKAQSRFGMLRTHSYNIIRQGHCPVLSYCVPEQAIISKGTSAAVSDHEILTTRSREPSGMLVLKTAAQII